MKHVIILTVVLVLFAIFYPMIAGRRWPSEMVTGYRVGVLGAVAVMVTYSIMWIFFPHNLL